MTPAEVDDLFQTHEDFISNTRTLSLAPLVKNIDLNRTEYNQNNTKILERTTREWTASLRDPDGSSWKCDVENGSDNREVKLIVPLENLDKARLALKQYKESIAPFNMRENTFSERINQAHPTEIYVPTIVATNNLSFVQKLSSSSIWANAPASIKISTSTNAGNYTAPNFSTTDYPPLRNIHRQLPRPIDLTKADSQKTNQSSNKGLLNTGISPAPNHSEDTQTTHSMMTATMGTNQARFVELENAIRSQMERIKQHQQEFLTVQTRFDELDNRTLKTMEFCQESSLQVMELRQDSSQNLIRIRQEMTNSTHEFRQNFAHMHLLIQQLTDRLSATTETPVANNQIELNRNQTDDMSETTHVSLNNQSAVITSPEKKKRRPRSPTSSTNLHIMRYQSKSPPPPNQEQRAQYNQTSSTPDQGIK
jgi:hypothetical protein